MKCFSFFNFGNKCILELLVATYTLRKTYSGEIVWVLEKNDEWNNILSKQVENLKIKIVWMEFNKFRKNTKSAIKPYIFKELFKLGYESIIMCDGDLLFLKKVDDYLFDALNTHNCFVTKFCDWKTNGKIMTSRLSQLKGFIPDKELKDILNRLPAINIGIMGFNNKSSDLINKWDIVTSKLAGKHIADEISAHVLITDKNCITIDSSYNASAKIGDLNKVENSHIVHFHGGSQGGGDVDIRYEDRRRSSRLWMAYLYDMHISGVVQNMKMWEQYSTGGIYNILQQNPNLPFECYTEFLT